MELLSEATVWLVVKAILVVFGGIQAILTVAKMLVLWQIRHIAKMGNAITIGKV